jgi:phytoene synthase
MPWRITLHAELEDTAARVTLAQSYAACRALHRAHGTTYYWATKALPRVIQPHVHALYGLCRYADEIVDAFDDTATHERAEALAVLDETLQHDLHRRRSDHLVLKAAVHTAGAFDLDAKLFSRFFMSMTRDLHQSSYDTFDDLAEYMDGSAAVIGEMMLPLLDPDDPEAALSGARALGIAFQLTNFLRDVGEDLDRGRVYFPRDELAHFGADPRSRQVDDAWRAFCRFQIARIRAFYREADHGVTYLSGRSASGIRAARRLYAEILDRIEINDYDVFSQRARVVLPRKLAVAAREMLRVDA